MDIPPYRLQVNTFRKKLTTLYTSLSGARVLALFMLLILSIGCIFVALIIVNSQFLVPTPTYGGAIHEGILGTPRFINPVLATSEQDKDLTNLIFAGLTKRNKDGIFILDMAENVEESEDHLKYVVTLKKEAVFHDGEKVISDDVLYTVGLIQNPLIKSPHHIEWEGIALEKKSDSEIVFTLKKPFPLFMKNLSIGILPKHIWKNLTEDQISLSDFNIHAIGSGPYSIQNIVTESGIPTLFTLQSYDHYTLGRPYVNTISISTYQNEKYMLQAFSNSDITRIHGVSPEKISTFGLATSSITLSLLPRTFAIFFNPNKLAPLADKNTRQALQLAINKQAIVDQVLYKYGKVITAPYPFDEESEQSEYNPEKAKEMLLKQKTSKNASSTLTITLATANTDEMKKVAEMIRANWEAIGVKTTISIYEVSDLNQNIIKERDFQALLFGAITQSPADLYAFWHSSQRSYPGLNISNYVSKSLDEDLETLRTSTDPEKQLAAYTLVRKEFAEETPGIFLYSPQLIYITNDKISTFLPRFSYDNSSRFMLVESWYRYKDMVWPKTYYKPLVEMLENIIH